MAPHSKSLPPLSGTKCPNEVALRAWLTSHQGPRWAGGGPVPGARALPAPRRPVCGLASLTCLAGPHPGGTHAPRPRSPSPW